MQRTFAHITPKPEVNPASKIMEIFDSQVSFTGSLLQEKCRILYNTAVTKQWSAKWPLSRMLFSEWYLTMVNKVTFIGFREGNDPNRLPKSTPALNLTKFL